MSLPAPATPPSLPLVAADVPRQFARRGDLSDAQFLYGEVARRMLGRLQYIRVQPQAMLDAGCGAGDNLALLRERYAEAAYTGLDNCEPLLEIARKRHAPAGLSAWIGKLARRGPANAFVNADLAATGLAPESLELVWSNLALHWHREPHAVLAEWRRILKVGGLAMFSCLGPATLRELRQALDDAGLRTATPAFVDMHDFGDLLVENGFADPVMDQEILTLTYRTPEKLLRERYAEAAYTGLDNCEPLLEIARKRHAPAGLSAWIGKLARRGPANAFVNADLAATGLAPESLELVWSNLALHWHREPHAVLAEWRRILKVGGLAMFSCLGPATLRELRQALDDAGLRTATPAFVDMHDFGDLLVENGFADPVMDQEILTLTYRTPEKLLQDVRALGGNPAAGRRGGLVGRDWQARLCAALEAQRRPDGVIALSIEVAYGHAWRAATHRGTAGETRLSVSAIGGRQRGTP